MKKMSISPEKKKSALLAECTVEECEEGRKPASGGAAILLQGKRGTTQMPGKREGEKNRYPSPEKKRPTHRERLPIILKRGVGSRTKKENRAPGLVAGKKRSRCGQRDPPLGKRKARPCHLKKEKESWREKEKKLWCRRGDFACRGKSGLPTSSKEKEIVGRPRGEEGKNVPTVFQKAIAI